jgi:hypothetical protein
MDCIINIIIFLTFFIIYVKYKNFNKKIKKYVKFSNPLIQSIHIY